MGEDKYYLRVMRVTKLSGYNRQVDPPSFRPLDVEVTHPVTICIATICQDSSALVVATDRMITARFLSLEFEHPDSKIDLLAEATVGLTAGDALANTELFRAIKGKIRMLQSPSVELIGTQIKEEFVRLRQQMVADRYLKPRGLTFNGFYKDGLLGRLPLELGMTIDNAIQRERFPLEVIAAGVDDMGAHIYVVTDPGVLDCYDRLGYHAIGSGESHALLTVVGSEHSMKRGINETAFLVYEAKRKAELAEGVGQATEMAIITDGGIRTLSDDDKSQLEEIYKQKMAPQLEHVEKAVSKLSFGKGE